MATATTVKPPTGKKSSKTIGITDILKRIINVSKVGDPGTINHLVSFAEDAHSRIICRGSFLALTMFAVGATLNWCGYPDINWLICSAIVIVVPLVAIRPKIFLAGLALSAVVNWLGKKPGASAMEVESEVEAKSAIGTETAEAKIKAVELKEADIKEAIETEIGMAKDFILWSVLIFGAFAEIPVRGKVYYAIAFAVAMILKVLMNERWKIGKLVIGKRLAYFFVICIIIHRLSSLVSPVLPALPRVNALGTATVKMADSLIASVHASVERSRVKARRNVQFQRTWIIPVGTLTYDCASGRSCDFMAGPRYNSPVEGVSRGDPIEINGIIYEKLSLPDPVSGKVDSFTSYIPVDKLVEKTQPPPGNIAKGRVLNTRYKESVDMRNPAKDEVAIYSLDPREQYVITGKSTRISFDNGMSWVSTDQPFSVPDGITPYLKNTDREIVKTYEVVRSVTS